MPNVKEESPFERTEEAPIRITSVFGQTQEEVNTAAQRLIDIFGWKYHSVAYLRTVNFTVYSIILWNTKPNA